MTNENKNGYAICFNDWLFNDEIKNELHILLLISSLCAKEGVCFASNAYFAEKFYLDEVTISRKIKKLEKLNHIKISYIKRGCEVLKREIRLTKLSTEAQKYQSSVDENINRTIDENVKDNITSINNITTISKDIVVGQNEKDNNNNEKNKKFKKPKIEEIETYCSERKNKIDATYFFDYYESKGWKIGKNPMKDWKAAIRTWERKEKDFMKDGKNGNANVKRSAAERFSRENGWF